MGSARSCRRGLVLTAAVLTASACSGLQFRNDHRLHITAPRDLQKVALPMTLTWTMHDPSPGQASYAVFVDRAPIKPGQTLRSLFDSQRTCQGVKGCPTIDQLNDKFVYTTTDTHIVIPRVDILPAGTGRKIHTFTVVLLDQHDRRIGEAAWERDVEIPKSLVHS